MSNLFSYEGKGNQIPCLEATFDYIRVFVNFQLPPKTKGGCASDNPFNEKIGWKGRVSLCDPLVPDGEWEYKGSAGDYCPDEGIIEYIKEDINTGRNDWLFFTQEERWIAVMRHQVTVYRG
jgi:hypothetical protein